MSVQSTHPLMSPRSAGVERDAIELEKRRKQFAVGVFKSIVLRKQYALTRFLELRERWLRETQFTSSSTEMGMNAAYQEIIGIGEAVIPFVLQDLRENRHHWFWALMAITGQDPVEEEHQGDVDAMARDWIKWGQREGLL